MSADAIEAQLQATAKAPRITPADIEAEIAAEFFINPFQATDYGAAGEYAGDLTKMQMRGVDVSLQLLTVCVLVLRNGFTVTGESACASPENFNADIGRQIARKHAVEKIWPLLGYELRSQLAKGKA